MPLKTARPDAPPLCLTSKTMDPTEPEPCMQVPADVVEHANEAQGIHNDDSLSQSHTHTRSLAE
ncbi:hypothetical protein BKA81DRAFT_365944 [Phyllosticta paracitricarpa]